MSTTREITSEVQEKVLDSVKVGQQAIVDSVRSWATTTETYFSKLPELSSQATSVQPADVFESTFAFTERLLASQRDFASQLFEATLPMTRAASAAAGAGANAAKTAARKS
jgi:hypothetical protein